MKNNWNKILNELSYRTSSGIPDLSNEQHLMKLWDILKEHKWSVDARVELLKNLNELEFKDKAALQKYASKHKIKPDTKVTIGDKETTAGDELPDLKDDEQDEVEPEANVDKEREEIGGEIYTEPLETTDEDFNKNNKENQITEPFVMPDVVKNNPKIPKKYTQFIERVMNTKKNIKDGNNYSDYYGMGKAGAGNTDANAGELMSMMATTMNRNDRVEFFKAIDKTIERASINGEKLYITPAWSKAAKENSSAILRMMYDK